MAIAVVATFVIVAVLAALAVVVLGGGDEDDEAGADRAAAADVEDEDDDEDSPGSPGAPNSGGGSSPAPTVATPTSAPRPSTTVATTPAGAPFPLGSWVMVRVSLRDRAAAETWRNDNLPSGIVLDTNLYASLTPDYFAVVIGPFASGADAVTRCLADGLGDRNDCFGALLSADPADRDQRAYPD